MEKDRMEKDEKDDNTLRDQYYLFNFAALLGKLAENVDLFGELVNEINNYDIDKSIPIVKTLFEHLKNINDIINHDEKKQCKTHFHGLFIFAKKNEESIELKNVLYLFCDIANKLMSEQKTKNERFANYIKKMEKEYDEINLTMSDIISLCLRLIMALNANLTPTTYRTCCIYIEKLIDKLKLEYSKFINNDLLKISNEIESKMMSHSKKINSENKRKIWMAVYNNLNNLKTSTIKYIEEYIYILQLMSSINYKLIKPCIEDVKKAFEKIEINMTRLKKI